MGRLRAFRAAAVLATVVVASALAATPVAAAVPPASVVGLNAVPGHGQVALSWTTPDAPDIEGVLVRRSEGSVAPATPDAGVAVYRGAGTSAIDVGLVNGVSYAYSVWTVAAGATYSEAAVVSATPIRRTRIGARLVLSERRVTAGGALTVLGRLQVRGSNTPVAGEPVELQRWSAAAGRWRTTGRAITDGTGRSTWRVRPQLNAEFRIRHLVNPHFSDAISDSRVVLVRPWLRASLGRDWARTGGSAKVRGAVRPSLRNDRIVLELRAGGRWRRIARADPDAEGRFRFAFAAESSHGSYRYRVVVPERQRHEGARSASMTLNVVRVVTYQIETRGSIVVSMTDFRQRVAEIYADPRGWSSAGVRFREVRAGGDFSVVLSQASRVPSFDSICDRYWSCRVGRYVIINQNRWRFGTPYFLATGSTVRGYRAMVVNHETGHWFGLGHATCRKAGARAPVMMQQSKGLYGCKPNPWPLPGEISRVR